MLLHERLARSRHLAPRPIPFALGVGERARDAIDTRVEFRRVRCVNLLELCRPAQRRVGRVRARGCGVGARGRELGGDTLARGADGRLLALGRVAR